MWSSSRTDIMWCRSVSLECGPMVKVMVVMRSAVVYCWGFYCVSRGIVRCGGGGVLCGLVWCNDV